MATALETVQQMYAAFNRGDTPAILDMVEDDAKWDEWEDRSAQHAGVSWVRGGTGKAAAAEFFTVLGKLRSSEFRVLGMMASDSQVAAEVAIDATLPNGIHVKDEVLDIWNLNSQGKVIRFRHYIDTAKHVAAAEA